MVKEEVFTVEVCHTNTKDEQEMVPKWAEDLRSEVKKIQDRLNNKTRITAVSESTSSGTDDAFFTENKDKSRGKDKYNEPCKICNLKNHSAKFCYQRICENCSGRGHDAEKCPSRIVSKKNRGYKNRNKKRTD